MYFATEHTNVRREASQVCTTYQPGFYKFAPSIRGATGGSPLWLYGFCEKCERMEMLRVETTMPGSSLPGFSWFSAWTRTILSTKKKPQNLRLNSSCF